MKTYKDNKNQVNIIRGGCILFVKVRTDERLHLLKEQEKVKTEKTASLLSFKFSTDHFLGLFSLRQTMIQFETISLLKYFFSLLSIKFVIEGNRKANFF